MPKTEIFDAIAARLDTEIHRNYRLYPCNYVALDLLKNSTQYVSMYTPEDKAQFETYIEGQLTKIELPNKDEAYLKERLLTMYANPAINYLATV
jgi:hypothetical protein